MGEGFFLLLKGALQREYARLQRLNAPYGRQFKRRGIGVVGRLVPVDVVQGRHTMVRAERLSEKFERPVCQHFVHVHVGAGARASLQRVYDHVFGEESFGHLPAGPLDGGGLGRVVLPCAEGAVRRRARQLHRAVGHDQRRMDGAHGQGEVLQRPHGVDAVQRVPCDNHRAEQVLFPAGGALMGCGHGRDSMRRLGGSLVATVLAVLRPLR